jgi:chromosome segregation ATPase
LDEKGKYIMALIGLKLSNVVEAKTQHKIYEKYDLMSVNMYKDCENISRDCSYIEESIRDKRNLELENSHSNWLGDMSWCNNPDIADNIKYIQNSKLKYCKEVDNGGVVDYYENEEEFKEIEEEFSECPGAKDTIKHFRNVSPRVLTLSPKKLCEKMMKEMHSVVKKCKSNKKVKK